MPPERCVEPELLFPELAERGCTFDFELVHEEPVAR
jgi:hypothetical protein